MSETESPKREHTWADVLCPCCGHMTYHRGHVGCIWPAKNRAAVDLALQTLETKSEEADKVETPTLIPGTALMATPDDGYGRYTNLDSTTRAQKRSLTHTTQAEIDAPTNTVGYVKATNARALCGFTDWRLPTLRELKVMYWHREMLGMVRGWYWASSPYGGSLGHGWHVGFDDGHFSYSYRDHGYRVRLVRDTKEKERSETESSNWEHPLTDVRCQCCGYMTYHREHKGCIRAAKTHATVELALQTWQRS